MKQNNILFTVVGMRYYIDSTKLFSIKVNDKVELIKEPDNKIDKNAVKVLHNGEKIGYISKFENKNIETGFYKIVSITKTAIKIIKYVEVENKTVHHFQDLEFKEDELLNFLDEEKKINEK